MKGGGGVISRTKQKVSKLATAVLSESVFRILVFISALKNHSALDKTALHRRFTKIKKIKTSRTAHKIL